MISLVAVVGPTGAGKTALATELALQFGGEIVGADSRQLCRHMDIGTGKPTAQEQARVPNHLIDVVDPDQEFSVALYQRLAGEAIEGIRGQGKRPFLVGGTGHYVWALLEGLRVPQVPPDHDLRRELYAIAEEEGGIDWLSAQLEDVDPVAARRIDPRNVRRVIRAIEVSRATGRPFSEIGRREPPPYRTLILGLTAPRPELHRRIDERVDRMIERGWVEEVQRLLAMGYSLELPALSSLGYREIAGYLKSETDLPTAVQRIKTETRRYARRQYAWFRLSDPRIRWFDITQDPLPQVEAAVQGFLKKAQGSTL